MRRPRGERSAAGAGRRLESCNFHECWLVQHVVHVKAGTQSCGHVFGGMENRGAARYEGIKSYHGA